MSKALNRYLPLVLAVLVAVVPSVALAGATATLGGVIENTIKSSSLIPGLFAGAAYLFGIVLVTLGIMKLYEHVINPGQVHVFEGIKRIFAGGGFLALPIVLEASYQTVAGTIPSATETSWAGKASAGGLDAVVTSLMTDVWIPMSGLISAFCYLAGIILVMVGIMRMLKSMQDGVKGPGGIGTIMTFLVAGALLAIGPMMAGWSTSMFGTEKIATNAALQYTAGMSSAEVEHVHAVISSVLAFMMLLGWVSFVRGFFILRAVSEGDSQGSLMAAFTHLFGGALAANLGPLLNAVQETLGLTSYGLLFS